MRLPTAGEVKIYCRFVSTDVLLAMSLNVFAKERFMFKCNWAQLMKPHGDKIFRSTNAFELFTHTFDDGSCREIYEASIGNWARTSPEMLRIVINQIAFAWCCQFTRSGRTKNPLNSPASPMSSYVIITQVSSRRKSRPKSLVTLTGCVCPSKVLYQ